MKKSIKYVTIFIVAIFFVIVLWDYVSKNVWFLVVKNASGTMELNYKFSQEALEKSNIEICKKVSTGYMMSGAQPRKNCVEAVIKESKDDMVCESVSMQEYQMDKNECYVTVSSVTDDPKICSKITIGRVYDTATCFGRIARNNHNINLCKEQKESEIKRICFSVYPEFEDVAFYYLSQLKELPSDFYFSAGGGVPDNLGNVQFVVSSKKDIYYRNYIQLKQDTNGVWQVVYFGEKSFPGWN